MKKISVKGLPIIGKGANGTIYRLDEDKIVKVYNSNTNSLDRIEQEKYVAKKMLIYDIPTAISYDIVKIDDKYGLVYEWINAFTLGQYLSNNPDQLDEIAIRMAKLLVKLHSTKIYNDVLPDGRENLHMWVNIAEQSGYYSDEVISKLRNLINSIPYRNSLIHGDFHPGNIMVMNDELLLIDMMDVSVGDPIIDLFCSYQIMKLVPQRPGGAKRYTGMSNEMLLKLWSLFIKEYTGITNKDELNRYEQKLKFYALIRSMPGITFSELVPKEELIKLTKEISNHFLKGYDIMSNNVDLKTNEVGVNYENEMVPLRKRKY